MAVELVDRELRTHRWHLGFAAPVEECYEADEGAARRRQLLRTGLAALLVYDLFLINDYLVRPEVLLVAIGWRIGCLSSYGLAVLAVVRKGLPPRWREAAMASSLVVAMCASGQIFARTTSAAGVYDPFCFTLIFLAGNIVFPLRFVPAIVSSAVAFGISVCYVLAYPGMPAEAKPFIISLQLGTVLFTSLACYRMERSARRSYLLVLREALRSEAAQRTADEMAVLSQTDPLTQLANRRAFEETLRQQWIEARQRRGALVLLFVDIDDFKRYNDRYGHPAGDDCLRRVSLAMRSMVRDGDFVARLGGEEFAVLLRDGSPLLQEASAERLRAGVEGLGIAHEAASGRAVVTISVGAAIAWPRMQDDPRVLIESADAALYAAKRRGRNRCELAGPPSATKADEAQAHNAVPIA